MTKTKFKTFIVVLVIFLSVLSFIATVYRYIILEDLVIDSKPIEEFTEDDL